MNIHLVPFEEIEFPRYDGCVNYASNNNIFGYSWYLKNVVKEFDVLVEENYQSVMPLVYRDLRLGGRALIHHPLTGRLGIYSVNMLNQTRINAFLDSIPSQYKNTQLIFNEKIDLKTDYPSFQKRIHEVYKMKLSDPYEDLRNEFTDEVVNILENEESRVSYYPVQLTPEKAVEHFINFTRLNSWEHTLLRLIYNAKHRGILFPVHLQDENGEVVSVSYFVYGNKTITQLFLASANADPVPQILTIDMVLRKHADSALTFDMNTIQAALAQNFNAESEKFYSLTQLRKREKWMQKLGIGLYKKR